MLMPTKILVPTDFSAYSDKALRQAFDIAKQYNAKVYVLHVVHEKLTDTIDDYGITYPSYVKRDRDEDDQRSQKEIEGSDKQISTTKELEIVPDVLIGNTSEAILEEKT